VDRFLCHAQVDPAGAHHQETEMIPQVINIMSAELAGDHRIRLSFDDGTQQEVDFKPFLEASVHPDIRAYLSTERFAAFRLEYGELVWDDYALCFPVADLYRNHLAHTDLLKAA
jgi:hypothetical protein